MKTALLTVFVVLVTAGFAFAQVAAGGEEFPFFHLGCLVIGGLIVVSLKQKYQEIYLSEALGTFALYAVLVTLFTSPAIEAVRTLF